MNMSNEDMNEENVLVERATESDYPDILRVQRAGFLSEARAHNKYDIHALVQTLDELKEECREKIVLKAIVHGEIVGTARGNIADGVAYINKLAVLENQRGKGIGTKLLNAIESCFPNVSKFSLGTSAKSSWNIEMYRRHGYKVVENLVFQDGTEGVIMEKQKMNKI